jgi:hypothetical protein
VNKHVNTVVFLVGATLFNIVLMFFFLLLFLGLAGIFLPVRTGLWAEALWILLFLAAIASAWFTYRWLFNILKTRIRLERYFDPFLFKDKWF